MTEEGVSITVKGLPAAIYLAEAIPGEALAPAIRGTFLKLLEFSKSQMVLAIMRTTRTEKTTGRLAESIEGYLKPTSGPDDEGFETYEFVVGSALEHALYAASDIKPTPMYRPVKVHPGRWRFIGLRPMIPRHPFLDQTLVEVSKEMPKVLRDQLIRFSGQVQKNVDELQRKEGL